MGIFKAYDVRGLYPRELDEETGRGLGFHFGKFLGGSGTVALGRDMRPSSTPLGEAVSDGLRRAGCSVLDIGLVTTPCLYFAVGSKSAKGGIMITASHNPAQYNGFKLCGAGATPIGSESGLKELEAAVGSRAALPAPAKGASVTRWDPKPEYVAHLLRHAGGRIGSLSVAFDCGNGAVGAILPQLLDELPQIRSTRLYFEPDGTFPNHEANPLVEANLEDVKKAVKDGGCDLGVAYDGDGDRVFFIDEEGETIPSDLMTALLARRVLEKEKGAAIIFDLRSSRVVAEEVTAAGGRPVEERVGHSFIKKTMREQNAPFAGELSGHFYWRDHFYCDTALLTTVKVLALASEGRKLSDLMRPLRRTTRSGEINFEVEDKDGALARLEKEFPGAEIARIDGVTVRLGEYWFNARKSNTEPLLRLNVEASSPAALAEAMRRVEGVLGKPSEHH
ncbi:MAG: phosphomannomutase/phosphoglucomutase [Planctomycetota bacterium]